MSRATRPRQAGVTAIGFLFLATAFGLLGFAAIKVVPLYMEKMRVSTVLEDLEQELQGGGKSPVGIRTELEKRFSVEGVDIPRENVTIEQGRAGYNLRIQHEARTPFMADLWFVLVFDEQVEIAR